MRLSAHAGGRMPRPPVTTSRTGGDSGYGLPRFPADPTSVVAVGGPSPTRADNARGWSATVWNS